MSKLWINIWRKYWQIKFDQSAAAHEGRFVPFVYIVNQTHCTYLSGKGLGDGVRYGVGDGVGYGVGDGVGDWMGLRLDMASEMGWGDVMGKWDGREGEVDDIEEECLRYWGRKTLFFNSKWAENNTW